MCKQSVVIEDQFDSLILILYTQLIGCICKVPDKNPNFYMYTTAEATY